MTTDKSKDQLVAELAEAKVREEALEARVREALASVQTQSVQTERLVATLREARDQIVALKSEIDKLSQPPAGFGIFLTANEDGSADIFTGGRKMRVMVSSEIETDDLQRGQEVMLNEALNVVEAFEFERGGPIVTFVNLLEDGERAVVSTNADEELVIQLAGPMLGHKLRAGDKLMCELRSGFALEVVPKNEVDDLLLEEVPDISYDQIGGLGDQIEKITDAIELPYLYPDLFREHELRPPKGVLLYGPPGCGKTLIAKAVANSLAKKVSEATKKENVRAYFINIKGPELLTKWVGETERKIREVFMRAREKASEGNPVVIFFDEMESLFRTRGSGVSSDVENTIVPQLLAEMDGVEGLRNVIVIGASNREDMIDPAILRPGRLDVKIKVERPDAQAAADIFSKYLTVNLPLHSDDLKRNYDSRPETVKAMINATVERMYSEIDENRFLEVTYANGDKEVMYFRDFNSGAMIQNIVDRAKKMAIKNFLDGKGKGLHIEHLNQAIVDEFKENEDLPNTTNPDDWARISGKKGERIVFIRTLVAGRSGKSDTGRTIDTISSTGQYL